MQQQVADHVGQVEEILQKRASNEVTKALQLVTESLLISTHSERLMERKAEALLMVCSLNIFQWSSVLYIFIFFWLYVYEKLVILVILSHIFLRIYITSYIFFWMYVFWIYVFYYLKCFFLNFTASKV